MEHNKEKIITLMNEYLDDASETDTDVVLSILEGLLKKREGHYSTYIASLVRLKGSFTENGDYEMVIPNQSLIANSLNIVHGGITATLLDTTMGTMVAEMLPKEYATVTTEMKVNYMKPGIGEKLRCVATLLHRGKHLAFTEGKVYNDKGDLIASASGTFFIVKKR